MRNRDGNMLQVEFPILIVLNICVLGISSHGKHNCQPRMFGPDCSPCKCVWINTHECAPDSGKCQCKEGFTGERCEADINECLSNPELCKGHLCVNTVGNYQCQCLLGEKNSSIGYCEPCFDGTYGLSCKRKCKCHKANTLFCNLLDGDCICKNGWEGLDCSQSVDDCKVSDCPGDTCKDRHLGYECICGDRYMIVQGNCEEYSVDMISLNTSPAIGEFVDIYLFFSLPNLYFKAPALAPNIEFKITDDQSKEECWTHFKLQSIRLTGDEPILNDIKMPSNNPYEVYLHFRKRFFKPKLTTVTAQSYQLHKKLHLVFDVKYKSLRVKNCLHNITIPGTEPYNISLTHKFNYSRQSYLMFEINVPPHKACFESPRVIWDYYLVTPHKNNSLCLNSNAFRKLDIDALTKKGGELLMSDHHQHKEIITKNTLPLGIVILCATAYVQRSISTKVITCGFINIVPAWIIIGKMWPGSSIMSVDASGFYLVSSEYFREPDKNTKLKVKWICHKPVELCQNLKIYTTRSWLVFDPNTLKVGHTYDFELKLSIKGHSNSTLRKKFQLVVGDFKTISKTEIFCLQSCSAFVSISNVMVLRAVSNARKYKWKLTEQPADKSEPAVTYEGKALKPFRMIKWHSSYFFSKVNAFKPGYHYTVECLTVGYYQTKGRSVYEFMTEELPKGKGCSISPLHGKTLFTKFTVKCKDYKDPTSNLPLAFKLYQDVKDKETKKTIIELVAYSNDGTFSDVTLSCDAKKAKVNLQIEISTMKQMVLYLTLSVDLSTDDQDDILSKTTQMRKTIGKIGSQEELRLVKDVATVMKASSTAPSAKKKKIRRQLFHDMKDFEAVAADSIEHSSTVLTELAAREDEVDDDGLTDGLAAAERITKYLGKCGGGNIEIMKDVADLQVSAMNSLVKVSSDYGNKINKRNISKVEKDHIFEKGKEHSRKTINSMSQIMTTLRGGFDISNVPIKIKKDTMEILLETNNVADMERVNMTSDNENVGFSVSSKNMNYLGNGSIESEFEVYEKSPFSFRSGQVHGDLPVVKVNFVEPHLDQSKKVERLKKKKSWQFSKPADIFLKNKNVNNDTIEYPTLLFVNKYTNEVYMSTCIYLSVKASTNETTVLEIFNPDNLTLKAKARYTNMISAYELLTDYDMIDIPFSPPGNGYNFTVDDKTLTRDSNFLFLPRLTKKQINSHIPYYNVKITIKKRQELPANFDKKANAPVMSLKEIVAKYNLTINVEGLVLYNVTVNVIPHKLSCIHFDEKKLDYSYDSCELSVFTTKEELHCRCVIAAAFSASYIIVPRLIDPLDFELFSEVFNNPLSVSMVIGLWIVFLALVIWGRRKDQIDEIKRGATLLEDNKVEDSYVYLLCVVTGNSAYARTTSNVYLFLKGSWGKSDIHVLKDNSRALFQSGAENWFVLTTENDLGYLTSAVVWTDYSGGHPSWFLCNIYVQNVQTGENWNLIYNSWFSAVKGSKHIMAEIPAVEESSFATGWLKNITNKGRVDLRNEHLWFGMVYKTAHNKFTRFRRLATGLSMLHALMILNLMFYDIKDVDDARQFMDVFGVRIHLTSIIIGLESCVLMSLLGFGLSLTFNRIVPRKPKVVKKSSKAKAKEEEEKYNTNSNNEKFGGIQTFLAGDVSDKDAQLLLKKLMKDSGKKEEEKDSSTPSNDLWFTLPWWFIYIYWGFIIVFNIFTAYYVMLYGLELGYEKSVNWVVSFFSGFLFNVLVVQPFKVVGMVLFVVLIFKQSYSLKEQAPFTSLADVSNAVRRRNQRYNNSAETKGSIKYYLPPNSIQLKDILNRLAIESSAREMLRDLLLYSVFLSAVLVMTYRHSDITKAFQQNKAMNEMLFNTHEDSEEEETTNLLDKISTVDDIWVFLHSDLVPFLVSEDHESLDINSFYFLGIARIRQVRVEKDEAGCDDIPYGLMRVYRRDFCGYSMTDGVVEKRDFNNSWDKLSIVVDEDDNEDETEDFPYKYRSASELNTASIIAPHYTYPGGGYVMTFPRYDIVEALKVVKTLSNSSWVDQFTRCIFVEFTIYNPEANLFTNVVIGFEFENSGGIFPFKMVSSSRLYYYERSEKQWTQTCEVVVAVCTAFYTVIVMKGIRVLGILSFLANLWNWVDVSILILVYTTAVLAYLRHVTLVSVLDVFAQYGNNRFLDFQAVFHQDFALSLVQGLLGGFVFIKLLHVLRFNPFSRTFTKSMDIAKSDVLGYTVMTFLYMFGFAVSGMIIFGRSTYQYCTLGRSLFSLLSFLLGEADYPVLVTTNRIIGPVYFIIVLVVTQYIIINFFIAMVRDGLDMARSMEFGKKDATVKYIMDTLKLYIGMGSNRNENTFDLYPQQS